MDELFTRCPTCKTVFRTHEDQLSVQAGKVRCGHCRMVFDGRAHLVDLTPQILDEDDVEAQGPPTVTLRRSMDLAPAPPESAPPAPAQVEYPRARDDEIAPFPQPRDEPRAAAGVADDSVPEWEHRAPFTPPDHDRDDHTPQPEDGTGRDPDSPDATPAGPPETPEPEETIHIEYSTPRSWADTIARGPLTGSTTTDSAAVFRPHTVASAGAAESPAIAEPVTPYRGASRRSLSRGARWAYSLLALLLLLLLAGQAAYHFRHLLAATQPALRPWLATACASLGCTIEPPRNKEDITIESHDLQADPAHQGLLILQTTMRNRSTHPVAFPHLEVELDDIAGKPVVRKVFAPTEYAGGAADFVGGIPASGEWSVKLFLDASGVNAGGYNLYLFYP